MPNNWEEWDKAHGRGGGSSSADKLAAMIKGTLGHDAAPRADHGTHGSVVHRTTKADMKRPAPVKGEKDRADSTRTRIRMAAYQRKKAEAVSQDPTDRRTPKVEQQVNPHKATSAAKIADQVKGPTDEQKAAHYKMMSGRAQTASESAKTASDHRDAAKAHERAAELAPSSALKLQHRNLADNHTASAAVEDRAEATRAASQAAAAKAARERAAAQAKESAAARERLAARQAAAKSSPVAEAGRSRYDQVAADADRLTRVAEADLDHEGKQREAAAAHRMAGSLASTPGGKAGHAAVAASLERKAKSAATLDKNRRIKEASAAAPAPRTADQSHGDRYRQLEQIRRDAGKKMMDRDTAMDPVESTRHSAISDKAKAEQDKLWPKLSAGDVAESVMQKSPGVDAHLRNMLTTELAKHVAYTGKNHSWRGITLDVAKIPNKKGPSGEDMRVGAHTVGGNHIVLNSDFLHRPGGGPVPKFNGFNDRFHSAGPIGEDEHADTRHILAHEIGHTQHFAITRVTRSQGDQEAHDLLGPHVHSATSAYGATNTHERAAEAYTASFARAHGHREYLESAADAGDHLVRQVKQKRGNS